jgi:hypothetical protein
MLKVLKWFALVLGVLLLAFIIIGFLLPSGYALERSLLIKASPEQIHQLVGDLRRWPEWAPWEDMDPSVETLYGPTTTGVGASQTWTSDSGGGELTFTKSDPLNGIEYDMSLSGAYLCVGVVRYEVMPTGTQVTWSMSGEMDNFIGRYMGLLMNSMVGPPFEAGLAKLKTAAEALPAMDPPVEEEPGSTEAAA